MTRDDIIRLAREAGFEDGYGGHLFPPGDYMEEVVPVTDEIVRLAALVAAAEREACAALVDANAAVCKNNSMLADVLSGTALAIRAAKSPAAPSEDIEALRQDAERYRWLRDWERGTHDIVPMTGRYCDTPILSEKLDAAIDAAMKEDKP